MEFFRLRSGLLPISRALLRASRPCRIYRPLQPPLRFLRSTSTSAAPQLPDDPSFPPPIVLRDYQEECIQSVLDYLNQAHKRLGVSLATGSGKTVIFTQLIGRVPTRGKYGDKTLIIVHRKELVEQAARHCRLAYPDRTVEIEMGNSVASGKGDIIIASIRSLTSKDRIQKFDPNLFKLVLVDEAHHIVAPSYRVALAHLGLDEPSPDSPALVGVSATLSRFDGLKLGAAIDHIVYHKDYIDMIEDKWLSNAIFTTVKSQANLSKVKKDRSGDFALGELSAAVNTQMTNDITVRAWLAHAQDRKSTLVFCVDINHAKELTETFRNSGIDARYITSKTPKDVRSNQLLAFQNQEFPVLVNCGLFTEGTDIPIIDCILLARPTRSRNLLIQMIGRGLRLYPGKEDCHIIDMVASLATGIITTPTLFGLHPDEIVNKASPSDLKRQRETSPPDHDVSVNPALPDEDVKVTFTKYDTVFDLIQDIDLEKHIRSLSPFAWVRIGAASYVLSGSSGWMSIKKVKEGDQELYQVRVVSKFQSIADSPTLSYTRPRLIASAPDLETVVHAADTFAAREFELKYIRTDVGWRRSWASESQLRMLNRTRIKKKPLRSSDITRGQAADMITRLKLGGKKWLDTLESQREKLAKRKEQEELKKKQEVKVGPVEV